MYFARVFISLKPTVNDPQGKTIQGGLSQLGFDTVQSVRAGKYMEIRLDEDNESSASQKISEMCDKLLANPIIENYRFELEKVTEGVSA